MKINLLKSKVRKEFDAQSNFYDYALDKKLSIKNLMKIREMKLPKYYSRYLGREVKGFMKFSNVNRYERVLDVGCGTGRKLIPMAKVGAECYGVDISPKMIAILRKKIRKLGVKNIKNLRVGSMENLDYRKEFFDVITCIGVSDYYSLSFMRRVLLGMRNILKENGRIVIDFLNEKTNAGKNFYEREKKFVPCYLYKKGQITKMMESAGFSVARTYDAGLELFFLLRRKR